MISDREMGILDETERELRREVPDLARQFEACAAAGAYGSRQTLLRAATSRPAIIAWLALLLDCLTLGLAVGTIVFFVVAMTAVGIRLRREESGQSWI